MHLLKTEDGLSFNMRLTLDLGISDLSLISVFFTLRHKELIQEMSGYSAPLVFPDSVWVRTGGRNSGGTILDCKSEAEITLWFSSSDCANKASKFQGKIRNTVRLFLQ